MISSERQCKRFGHAAFTLMELVVVVAIIALLVMVFAPTVVDALIRSRAVICGNNLHELTKALQINTGRETIQKLPYASEWYTFVIDRGAERMLRCPEDDAAMDFSSGGGNPDPSQGFVTLADVYIVQNCTLFTNIEDALALGMSGEDPQITVNPTGPGKWGFYWKWVDGKRVPVYWDPPQPGPNQDLICIDDDGAIMVTYGDPITIESIDAPGDGTRCGSEHWIVVDDGSPNWFEEITAALKRVTNTSKPSSATGDPRVVMRLTGRRYANIVEEPYTVGTLRGSYGMSTAVHGTAPGPGQLMLVEFNTAIVRVTGDFTNLDLSLQPRHKGKAYYATTDGGVDCKTVDDLELEFDGTPNRGIWGPAK